MGSEARTFGVNRGGTLQGDARRDVFAWPGTEYKQLELIEDEFFLGQYRSATGVAAQVAATGSGSGLERFVASGSASQVAATGTGDGTVNAAPAPPVVVTDEPVVVGTGGRGHRVPILPWRISPKKKRAPKLPEEPQVICTGGGAGAQVAQTAAGRGGVGVGGRSRTWQQLRSVAASGSVRVSGGGAGVQNDKRRELAIVKRRREEEMLVQFLLRAA
jgi:hypothetical protein